MDKDLVEQARYHLWRTGDLRYKLDSLQIEIRETVNRISAKKVCILSSRQIGKSYLIMVLVIEYLIRNPGRIARIVCPTLKQANDIVNDNLARIILDAPPGFIERRRSDFRWQLENGSSLRLGALERANVDSNRGGNASLVVYEEVGFVSGADFIYGANSVLGPQLLRSNGAELFVSSPSEDPDHPLHTAVLPECEALGTSFRYTVFDSPSITDEMIQEAARRCGGFETDAFKREYLAQIIRPSSLMVVPGYDEKMHVQRYVLPVKVRWIVSIDWGGVRDKTVALLHGYDYLTNRDIIHAEQVWEPNTGTVEIVRGLKIWDEQYTIEAHWADVPGQLQVDLANEHNYQVQLPQKSDWLASVNSLAVKFTQNLILIDPSCTFCMASFRAGMFNKTRTDFERSDRLGHCDAIAAAMYAVRMADRENPYTDDTQYSPNFFIPAKAPEAEVLDLGNALNPKRFGKYA